LSQLAWSWRKLLAEGFNTQYPVFYIAFWLIALDIILRVLLIEKKDALQWDVSVSDELPTQPETNAADKAKNPSEPLDPSPTSSSPQFVPRKHPAVITLLSSRRFLTALWGCIVQGALLTAFDSVVPLFVQRGRSPDCSYDTEPTTYEN
jgi:hypothetical protein